MGRRARTLRLYSLIITPFGNVMLPSAPQAGMYSVSPFSVDARPRARRM